MEKHGEQLSSRSSSIRTDPSYILYTSGTTGKPKGVVRDTGGYMVALHASMAQIYARGRRRRLLFHLGHRLGGGPLLHRLRAAAQGRADDSVRGNARPSRTRASGGTWCAKYGVTTMFSAPTAMRVLRKFPESWFKEQDLSAPANTSSWPASRWTSRPTSGPRTRWATGHRPLLADGVGLADADQHAGRRVPADQAGIAQPRPAYGLQFLRCQRQRREEIPRGEKGFLVAKGPIPPGTLMTIWGDDERYKESYWEHYPGKLLYHTGDFAIMDKDGYLWMLGRADEVINVGRPPAGHPRGRGGPVRPPGGGRDLRHRRAGTS